MSEPTTVAHEILEQFTDAERARRVLTDRWLTWYQLYRLVTQQPDEAWQHAINLADVYEIVETMAPRHRRAIYPGPAFFTLLPGDPSDRDLVRAQSEILKYQFHDQIRLPKVLPAVLRQYGVFGATAMIGGGWDARRNCPMVRALNLFNLFLEPGSTSPDDAEWAIIRILRSRDAIVRAIDRGDYTTTRGMQADAKARLVERQEPQRRVTITGRPWEEVRDQVGGLETPLKGRRFEVLERWRDDHVETVVDGDIVLRDQSDPLPFTGKPIFFAAGPHLVDELYGVGKAEPIEAIAWVENDLMNQFLDNLELSIHTQVEYRKGADLDPQELVRRPYGTIGVSALGQDYGFVTPPAPNQLVIQQISFLKNHTRGVVGLQPYVSGEPPERRETLGGIVTLVREANVRIDEDAALIQEQMIHPMVEWAIEMNRAFLSVEQAVRIVGAAGVSFRKLASNPFAARADVRILAAPAQGDKSLYQQQLGNFSVLTKGHPLKDPKVELRLFAEAFDVPADILLDDTVREPEEEHWLMLQGVAVSPSSREDFGRHLLAHAQVDLTGWSEQAKALLLEHIQKTNSKQDEVRAIQQQAMLAAKTPSPPSPPGLVSLPRGR